LKKRNKNNLTFLKKGLEWRHLLIYLKMKSSVSSRKDVLREVKIHRKEIGLSNGKSSKLEQTPFTLVDTIVDLINKKLGEKAVDIQNFNPRVYKNPANTIDQIISSVRNQGVLLTIVGEKKMGKKAKDVGVSYFDENTPTKYNVIENQFEVESED
jgi:hypothetical protein